MADLVALRLEDSISRYSYVRDSIAYLEEDRDASAFIAAYTAACGKMLGINVLDHLVIGGESATSVREAA